MNWISVKDRLPNPNEPEMILVFAMEEIDGRNFYRIWITFFRANGFFHEKNNPTKKITHWMPLPEPPV